MTSFISMLDTQTEMLLYMAVGFLCWKKRIISKGSLQNFIDFLMSIALPAMVFNGALNFDPVICSSCCNSAVC